jgi:hypothetical protein
MNNFLKAYRLPNLEVQEYFKTTILRRWFVTIYGYSPNTFVNDMAACFYHPTELAIFL